MHGRDLRRAGAGARRALPRVRPRAPRHGRTADVGGPITYSITADDTIAFIEALGIGPALLVGFSDGGAVALLLALRRPDLVRKLVLIGQPANSDGLALEARAMMESLSADVLPPMLKALYAAVSPDGPDHFEAVFEKLKPSWLGGDDVELAELAKIPAPTLVLLGDRDMLTVEHAAAMQRALPDGQLAVVPGARHSLPWDRPELAGCCWTS